MVTRSKALEQLEKISSLIRPLNPPVDAFENSIRTSPFRVLVSVLLSSRTRDPVTLKASQKLFSEAETPERMVLLGEEKIRDLIYPVGFFRQKAKHILALSGIIAKRGGVPEHFSDLVDLPGVGRKTANLVLSLAFNKPAIAVDTHVFRISRRLGWAKKTKPEGVESELKALFPDSVWCRVNQTLVGFGQVVCKPQTPECRHCVLNRECPVGIQNTGIRK